MCIRALVVGGSSGIGLAVARRLATEGAVLAIASRSEGTLATVAEELGAYTLPLDVTDTVGVDSGVDRIASELGGLDVVVNTAGHVVPTSLEDLDDAVWNRHLDVNLGGAFKLARAVTPHLRESHGSLLMVSSELAAIGMADFVAYCSAKAGLIGLTRALAAELAPKVRVNALLPGPVDTPMLRGEFAHSGQAALAREQTVERVPLRRLGEAEEIAEAAYTLAMAQWATGSTWAIDGGTTAV